MKTEDIPEVQAAKIYAAYEAKSRSQQQVVSPSEWNHFFREPPRVGSVAVCGYVKQTTTGFVKELGTCNKCVETVLGPRKVEGPTG